MVAIGIYLSIAIGLNVTNNKYMIISDADAFKRVAIIKERDIKFIKVCVIVIICILVYIVTSPKERVIKIDNTNTTRAEVMYNEQY